MWWLPPPLLSYDAAGKFGAMFTGLLGEEETQAGGPVPTQVAAGNFCFWFKLCIPCDTQHLGAAGG